MAMAQRPDPTNEEILAFLQRPENAGKSMTAKEIGQAMGFQGRKNVNRQLHDLKKQGKVDKDETKRTPEWRLSGSISDGPTPGRQSAEHDGSDVYIKRDLGNGAMIFSPVTVEELAQSPSTPEQAETSRLELQRSELVNEVNSLQRPVDVPSDPVRVPQPESRPSPPSSTPPDVDVPSDPICVPQPESKPSPPSSIPPDVDVSSITQQFSQTSLTDATTSEESTQQRPPEAKPRRTQPNKQERQSVQDFLCVSACPCSVDVISKRTDVSLIIVKKILQEFSDENLISPTRTGDSEEMWSWKGE